MRSSATPPWCLEAACAASASRSAPTASASARNAAAPESSSVVGVLRAERVDDRLVGHRASVYAAALDDARSDATDGEPAYAVVFAAEEQRDDRAHRVADQVDLRRVDQVEQDGQIACHAQLAIRGRIVRLVRAAMAACVRGQHPAPGAQQRLDDPGDHPVRVRIDHEAVMKHHRWRGVPTAPFLVGDLDLIPRCEALDRGHRLEPICAPHARAAPCPTPRLDATPRTLLRPSASRATLFDVSAASRDSAIHIGPAR